MENNKVDDGGISMFIETISAGDSDCHDMYWAILKQNNEFAAKTFKYMSTFLRIRGELGGKFWRYCDKNVDNVFKFIKALVTKNITWADVLKDMFILIIKSAKIS